MTYQIKTFSSYFLTFSICILLLGACATSKKAQLPVAVLTTEYGNIEIELDTNNAPISANNFIAYIKGGHFKTLTFYRTVDHSNDNHPLKIAVLQGGLNAALDEPFDAPLPAITHESTAQTTLTHTRGAVSFARGDLGTAQSEFFISTLDNPHLDAGGLRHPDKLGFAVFGKVIGGMDVVDKIAAMPANRVHDNPYVEGQLLTEQVVVSKITLID
ncbi:peptidylprolyl isomerase [Aliiglaciecola sp. 2_MG-2023]|uniref:peptidylprolyl isomerase n=1 Tax=unclassified Aliiglaciecola TaxID=2593648 RepID=UPI0026E1658B|nr:MULTISPECIES: peptidylprolyl isomerase [unclassified Aliiglaciecola]MDO6711567.1 peptidylprolyl isomerase [Aliiglaciecola sp. 2_MG-2023]MDO6752638.1 peptidylprolyl isomerase [Aliiglaciecola sp. 1_MG-2023]